MQKKYLFRVFAALLVLALAGTALLGANSPVKAAAIKIMPLGDSITGSPGCWRALLWARLQSAGYTNIDFVGTQPAQGCSVPYDGDSEGRGGLLATGAADPANLPVWLAANVPDIVIMHLGTNDVWSTTRPTATILAAFTTMVGQMRTANPNVKILVAQILPMNPTGCATCTQGAIDLNTAIPAWASSLTTAQSPIGVVDQWTGFNDATDTVDGVHPNDLGSQKMSDKWYPALSALLSPTGPTATVTKTNTVGTPVLTNTLTRTPTPSNTVCPAFTGYVRVGSTTGPGLAGVLVTGVASTKTLTGTTDSAGYFVLGGCGVSGMVLTPTLGGYIFSPVSQPYTGSPLTFVAIAIDITPTLTRTVGPTFTTTRTSTAGPTFTPTRTPTVGPTFTRTITPTAGPTFTRTVTPTITPTGGVGCSPVTSTIAAPFTYDGVGAFCWQSSNLGAYINSWNLTGLTIDGVNLANLYVAAGSYPAKIGGYWYVSYISAVSYGHFEAK